MAEVVNASTTVGEEDRDALSRIEAMFDDLATRTQTVEKRMNRTDDTLDDHETRLAALEAAQRKDTTP